MEFGKRELRQIDTEFLGTAHGQPDSLMCIAERQTLARQVIGQIGGRGKALAQRIAHVVRAGRDSGDHVGIDAQRVGYRVNGVEQRFLVFLIVLVVGQAVSAS